MNVALIFAGGTGIRMNSKAKPKQFLELYGKPIIIYTLEIFEGHPEIDRIVVVCIEEWIEYLKKLIRRYNMQKVMAIIPGGRNTQESQYKGLKEICSLEETNEETIVLVHDGVRPLVDAETISKNIESVKQYSSAITVTPAIETIIYVDKREYMNDVIDRKQCRMAKAPQSFFAKELYQVHLQAIQDKKLDFIDSACLLQEYGWKLHTVEGNKENIKITTPVDFYLFRAITEAKENSQIWGI